VQGVKIKKSPDERLSTSGDFINETFLFLGFSPCPLRNEAAGVKYLFEKSKVKIPYARPFPAAFFGSFFAAC